ncbi:MAG: hypothetical protein IKU35_06400 [Bacteroidaceae bacterium]|nr:hypothetical protein [Bacteroidaceae bacterium]
MNPLFQMMAGGMPNNPTANLMQRFQQFKQSFNGNPQQMVQQMLQSGRITAEQYNNAVRMAQQLQGMLK